MKRLTMLAVLVLAGPARADLSDWLFSVGIGTPATFNETNIPIPDTRDIGVITMSQGATYEFIVNATSAGVSSALMGAKNTGVGNEAAFKFEQFPDTGQFGVTEWIVADWVLAPHVTGTDLHVVFVCDYTAPSVKLFVDGVSVSTAAFAPFLRDVVGIGQWFDPTLSIDILTGTMLGVATYDSMLPAAEVLDHSNAFHTGGGSVGTTYCLSATNSTGSVAAIAGHGTSSIASNNLTLTAGPVPNQPGIYFYGPSQTQTPFGNGFLCVGGQIVRLPVTLATLQNLDWDLDITNPPSAFGTITAGSTWNFQAWYRDPAAGGANFNLSDGLEVSFVP